jgi:hypothetical protein
MQGDRQRFMVCALVLIFSLVVHGRNVYAKPRRPSTRSTLVPPRVRHSSVPPPALTDCCRSVFSLLPSVPLAMLHPSPTEAFHHTNDRRTSLPSSSPTYAERLPSIRELLGEVGQLDRRRSASLPGLIDHSAAAAAAVHASRQHCRSASPPIHYTSLPEPHANPVPTGHPSTPPGADERVLMIERQLHVLKQQRDILQRQLAKQDRMRQRRHSLAGIPAGEVLNYHQAHVYPHGQPLRHHHLSVHCHEHALAHYQSGRAPELAFIRGTSTVTGYADPGHYLPVPPAIDLRAHRQGEHAHLRARSCSVEPVDALVAAAAAASSSARKRKERDRSLSAADEAALRVAAASVLEFHQYCPSCKGSISGENERRGACSCHDDRELPTPTGTAKRRKKSAAPKAARPKAVTFHKLEFL